MALSPTYQLYLRFAVTAIFFLSLTLPPLESGGIKASMNIEEELRKQMVLGSRPPDCVNKCMSCRPCEAALVIPHHKNTIKRPAYHLKSSHGEDDSYYLLCWKCRCGNKLYHP